MKPKMRNANGVRRAVRGWRPGNRWPVRLAESTRTRAVRTAVRQATG